MKINSELPSFSGVADWLNIKPSVENNRTSEDEVGFSTKGRPTLVHFWSLNCDISKTNISQIADWRDQRRREGLRVIAIHVPRYDEEKDTQKLEYAINRLNLTEPCAVDNDLKLQNRFLNGSDSLPAYFLFDAASRLRTFTTGVNGLDAIEDQLDRIFEDLRRNRPFCPECELFLNEEAMFCAECGLPLTLPGGTHPYYESHYEAALPTRRLNDADPLIGYKIDGRYELLARVGEGGMSLVYRARRVHIGDEVAVKILRDKYVNDQTALARFRREVQAAAPLHHPNVITIHDFGEPPAGQGPAFIVMEFIKGAPLRELLHSEKQFPIERALRLMRGICAGVGMAHRHGVVHRDLKPDNILVVAPDGDSEFESVKVVDFGFAKSVSETSVVPTGAVIGTPHYMSPEQCLGEPLDARSDVYSLGAMFYEMLSGNPPFTGTTVSGILTKQLTDPPPPLPQTLKLSRRVSVGIMQALAKDPGERPQTATDFARQLQLV
jgi:tRNA A-37 threonylcarbamoyl transferase component Bud32